MLNWDVLRNPMNWVTVVLMLYIASFAATLVLQAVKTRPSE